MYYILGEIFVAILEYGEDPFVYFLPECLLLLPQRYVQETKIDPNAVQNRLFFPLDVWVRFLDE